MAIATAASVLIRPAEVAELLSCSTSKAYQLIAERRIPSVRIAGSVRVPRAALMAWIERHTEDPPIE